MALGTPTLATPVVVIASINVTTASFTPTANSLLVVSAGARALALPGLPTIGNTGGLTFTPIIDGLYDIGSGARARSRTWAAVIGSSPGGMTVTSSTTAGRICIAVIEIIGQGGIPANAAATPSATGDPTMVLGSAPAASSLVLAFLTGSRAGAAITPPTGFTELAEADDTVIGIQCCYDMVSAPTSIAYSTPYLETVGTAVEVTEASGGAFRLRRPGMRMHHLLVR